MPRKIIVRSSSGQVVLEETKAENELELQELVKNSPDLLPIEEFGMTGPLLVIGRETTLPSGSVDLVALARSGELLIIEFKTGPQNTDFRRVLAQLLDYGSDIWSLTYDEFEATVPVRYFTGPYCQDDRLRGCKSLEQAARAVWPDLGVDELAVFHDKVSKQLQTGYFSYVVVAQRFAPSVERTAQYLNSVMAGAKTYAVELVRFDGNGVTAFETRTVLKPTDSGTSTSAQSFLDEEKFLESLSDEAQRAFLQEFFETCRGLGFRFEWGASGVSIRMPTSDRPEPLTVAWVFQPGRSGWMGLHDLNFGHDPASSVHTPSAKDALTRYVADISKLEGCAPAKTKGLKDTVWHLSVDGAIQHQQAIYESLAALISSTNTGAA